MRRAPKTLAAALVALLLAVGVTACGGGDDSDSTASDAASQQQSQADNASQSGDQGNEDGSGDDSSGSNSDGEESQSDASDFVPKQHNDSGGGSERFRTKGGDNSVQEFGEEAGSDEFDDAAVVLHNFLDARAEGNWAAACQYMSKAIIESFEKLAQQAKQLDDTSCSGILEKLINPAAAQSIREEAAKANVRSLRIENDGAFIIYTGVDSTILAMPMTDEDGDWKVASLAGTPLS